VKSTDMLERIRLEKTSKLVVEVSVPVRSWHFHWKGRIRPVRGSEQGGGRGMAGVESAKTVVSAARTGSSGPGRDKGTAEFEEEGETDSLAGRRWSLESRAVKRGTRADSIGNREGGVDIESKMQIPL